MYSSMRVGTPMYVDPQYGLPGMQAVPMLQQAVPIGTQPAYMPSSGGLMAVPPPQSFGAPSDPTIMHEHFAMEPSMRYQSDVDVCGRRVSHHNHNAPHQIFMHQGPQRGAHVMSTPSNPSGPMYGGVGGAMYLAASGPLGGDPGYMAASHGYPGGGRGKPIHHIRGVHHPQPQLMHHPQQGSHNQQQMTLQHQHQQHQQQPLKKRTQRGMEDNIRRTVYVSYIDLQVTEEMLATSFSECGTVVDCRICGDPNSAMRFAFIEFSSIAEAQRAHEKSGMVLGSSPLRVLPSKTAIVPVSRDLMPRSGDEVERCSRTVYVTNIDKKVDRSDVRAFFEGLCGPVSKLRLLGDYAHSTRISFIEFLYADSAMAALNCSGALLGSLPIRVSPSKTPVRSEASHKDRKGGSQNNQQLMLTARPHGQAGGSSGASMHDDDALYAAEQVHVCADTCLSVKEQIKAMHLAQTPGAPNDCMQFLEATLIQQQQYQQAQLASLAAPTATSPVLLQAPPSPPLMSATASATPSLLAQPPLHAPSVHVSTLSQPGLPQQQQQQHASVNEVAPSSTSSFASKYPVIRGRGHSAPNVSTVQQEAQGHPALVLPATVLPAPTRGDNASPSASSALLQAAALPSPLPSQMVSTSQPPVATTLTVMQAVDESTDALASQLKSQLQVQAPLMDTPAAVGSAPAADASAAINPPGCGLAMGTTLVAAAPPAAELPASIATATTPAAATTARSVLDAAAAAVAPIPLPVATNEDAGEKSGATEGLAGSVTALNGELQLTSGPTTIAVTARAGGEGEQARTGGTGSGLTVSGEQWSPQHQQQQQQQQHGTEAPSS